MAKRRGWQWDWAGAHGTAWGAINGLAGTVGVSASLHEIQRHEHLSRFAVAAVPFIAGLIGVTWIVAKALTGRPQPRATVVYKIACLALACLWCTYMVGHVPWAPIWWLASVGVLGAAGTIAGLIAGLADEPAAPAERPVRPAPREGREQLERNQLADEWVDRIARVTPTTADVLNIEHWARGNGYTLEGEVAGGGATWRTIWNAQDALAGDLNLAEGCRMDVRHGTSRRRFLVDVMTENMLITDHDYPDVRPVHSINDPLEVGMADDGNPIGPVLRSRSAAIGGEAGSGKSNAALCYAAEIITTDDAVLWQWDPTGKLWSSLMDLWLRREVDVPAVDWAAMRPGEILFQLRAAHRIATIRPVAYRRMMLDADDDKVPIGPKIPALMVMGDEVKVVTGAPATYPDLQDQVRLILEEGRAGGVRPLFFPLRGTDDMFLSAIQALCHVLGVMKVQSTSEASWMLGGTGAGFGPEDMPYAGCGGLKLESGAQPIKIKYYRMRPSTIEQVVRQIQDRRPVLDEVSRLAANGRNPDGTPMAHLLPGELDCYDTRWDRFMTEFGYDDQPAPRASSATPPPTAKPAGSTMAEELTKLAATGAELEAAVARARAGNGDDEVGISAEERRIFEEQMIADGFGPDWTDAATAEREETPAKPTDQQVMLDLIAGAGPRGIKPSDLHAALITAGIVFSRDTLHTRLREMKAAGLVSQPSFGRWALGNS